MDTIELASWINEDFTRVFSEYNEQEMKNIARYFSNDLELKDKIVIGDDIVKRMVRLFSITEEKTC